MNQITTMAMKMLQTNPNMKSNPMAQELMSIIQSGDSSKGEQLANNILQTYGIEKDDAIKQSRNFFHI